MPAASQSPARRNARSPARKVAARYCDRCPPRAQYPAIAIVRFSAGSGTFALDLCKVHKADFDREFDAWARLGREVSSVDSPRELFSAASQAELRRAADMRARQSEEDRRAEEAARPQLPTRPAAEKVTELTGQAMTWTLTHHAKERAVERGATLRQVLEVAGMPNVQYENLPEYAEHTRIYVKGELALAVDPLSRTVMTVMNSADPRVQRAATGTAHSRGATG